MELVHVTTREHTEFIDITDRLAAVIDRSGVVEGLANVQTLHTMTAVAIDDGEERDTAVRFSALPLTATLCLNVADGRLVLGRSQRVLLVELDGPNDRALSIVVVAAPSAADAHEHPRDSWIERRFSEALDLSTPLGTRR
jgi:thiamine phosphate synthase YjbQ (UPF0047 family)